MPPNAAESTDITPLYKVVKVGALLTPIKEKHKKSKNITAPVKLPISNPFCLYFTALIKPAGKVPNDKQTVEKIPAALTGKTPKDINRAQISIKIQIAAIPQMQPKITDCISKLLGLFILSIKKTSHKKV